MKNTTKPGPGFPGLPPLDDLAKAAMEYQNSCHEFEKMNALKGLAEEKLIAAMLKAKKNSIKIGNQIYQHRRSRECIVKKAIR